MFLKFEVFGISVATHGILSDIQCSNKVYKLEREQRDHFLKELSFCYSCLIPPVRSYFLCSEVQ